MAVKKTMPCDDGNIRRVVAKEIEMHGDSANLNHLNVSAVTNISGLFSDTQFNGDISSWDVSNVVDMSNLFDGTPFNGVISKWNVSRVKDMSNMFWASQFNGNISDWDVSSVVNMYHMFVDSLFNDDISDWDVSNVENMSAMFNCRFEKFNGDLSRWDVSNVRDMSFMFAGADFECDLSAWKILPECNVERMFEDSFPLKFRPSDFTLGTSDDIFDLNVGEINEGFDQDLNQLLKVRKFFNQKDLDWIKNNKDFVSQYQKSHLVLKHLMSAEERDLELPIFIKENVKVSTCTLLCMFFDAFGVAGYDPEKISQQNEMDMHLLTFKTLALGNETLLKSVQKSFCIHFNLISEVSLGEEESFSEMSNPTLADAIEFVEQVLGDPDATFNQS